MATRYKYIAVSFLLLSIFLATPNHAQSTLKDFGYKGGIQINGVMSNTEFENDNGPSLSSYLLRGFFRFELSKEFQTEFGIGYGKLSGDGGLYYKPSSQYETSVIPIDARLLYTPLELENWNPYLYGGIALMNYNVTKKPLAVSPLPVNESGWMGAIPLGIGTELKLSETTALDFNVGYTFTFTDNLNYYSIKGTNDGYFTLGVGLSFSNESLNGDGDHDGLNKRQELELGSDPSNPDTDGDGLSDGDEFSKYKTDMLNKDSDGDGLNDYEEIMSYKTNPSNRDTDSDGLIDGEEVKNYKTDPLKADTDSDGLPDGAEVMTYKTNPLKIDTDGDGLSDNEEVSKYKTNPMVVDTDGGTISDGIEVKRGTNPLDSNDDVAKESAEAEKELTLDPVHFGFDKSNLTRKAKSILDKNYINLSKISDAKITLSGHTDNIGSQKYNMKLSQKRANVVKKYLLKKGLDEKQISTEVFGKTKPADETKTLKARAVNRRVEIKAVVVEKK